MDSVTASTTPKTHLERKREGAPDPSPTGEERARADDSADDDNPLIPPKRGSLARRMGLIAAGWIIVLLLGGGIALERTLTSQVERNFDEQLEYILTAMIASAEIGPDGEAALREAVKGRDGFSLNV